MGTYLLGKKQLFYCIWGSASNGPCICTVTNLQFALGKQYLQFNKFAFGKTKFVAAAADPSN